MTCVEEPISKVVKEVKPYEKECVDAHPDDQYEGCKPIIDNPVSHLDDFKSALAAAAAQSRCIFSLQHLFIYNPHVWTPPTFAGVHMTQDSRK